MDKLTNGLRAPIFPSRGTRGLRLGKIVGRIRPEQMRAAIAVLKAIAEPA
jgi:hypothetical protein